MHAKMYKLGKLTCGLSIFKKHILKNVHNRKMVRTNTYTNNLTKKKRLRNIYKQTNVTSISKFRILNQQLIKRP